MNQHTITGYVRLPCAGWRIRVRWLNLLENSPNRCAFEFNPYTALLATTPCIGPGQRQRT